MEVEQTLKKWHQEGGTIKWLIANWVLASVVMVPAYVLFLLILYAIATYASDPEAVLGLVGWVAILWLCIHKTGEIIGQRLPEWVPMWEPGDDSG